MYIRVEGWVNANRDSRVIFSNNEMKIMMMT